MPKLLHPMPTQCPPLCHASPTQVADHFCSFRVVSAVFMGSVLLGHLISVSALPFLCPGFLSTNFLPPYLPGRPLPSPSTSNLMSAVSPPVSPSHVRPLHPCDSSLYISSSPPPPLPRNSVPYPYPLYFSSLVLSQDLAPRSSNSFFVFFRGFICLFPSRSTSSFSLMESPSLRVKCPLLFLMAALRNGPHNSPCLFSQF